jgi:hypothetical protein
MSNSKDKEELKELLNKLKTLAERGVGGEKETAQKKLTKLLAENNMTEADLAETEKKYYLFSYKFPYRRKLLCQCIYKVLGAAECQFYITKGKRNKVGAYCTPSQKVEIELDFEFYSSLLDEEIKTLTAAFIDKQDLFPKDVPNTILDAKEMSENELEKYTKRQRYASNINKRVRASALIEDSDSH